MKPEHKKYILENINRKPIDTIARELNIKARKIRKFIEKEKKNKKQVKTTEDVTNSAKTDRRIIFISVILIAILGFIVYSNSINGEFIWDDEPLVRDNVYIRSLSNLPKIVTQDIGAGAGRKYHFYRPLLMLTYVANSSLGKLDVKIYHLTNIILHILVALSIFWLVNILFSDEILSLFTSILFIVHPLHTEAIAYISGRADPLSTIFIISSLIFYIKYLNSERPLFYIIVLLSYALALLSRESSLSLPIVLLLYHYAFKKKLKFKEFLSILGVTFAYILMRFTVLRSLLIHLSSKTTLFQRIPGFFVALTNYIKLILLPFNLHMEYGNTLFNLIDSNAILGVFMFSFLLFYAFKKRNSNRLVFFSISWFFITLLPQSNLYPIYAYMAEHWLYLPSIGFFLISANVLDTLYKKKEFKTFTTFVVLILVLFYSYLTMRQNNYWKGPIIFYERTLKYAPGSFGTYYNLGIAYENMGKYENAIHSYKKAIEIKPDYTIAYNNLGHAYYKANKYEEAIASYRKAIEIKPDYATAYNNLGVAYYDIGKKEEAIAAYKKVIEINPNYGAVVYTNLGVACGDIGKIEEAIASHKKAIEIKPDFAMAYNNLAAAYYYNKEYDLAIKHCDMAIELGYKVSLKLLKLLEPYRRRTSNSQ